MENPIINLLTLLFPKISQSLAVSLSLGLAFIIGIGVSIPAVMFWIRKNLPTLIAFLMYVYQQTENAERMVSVSPTGEKRKLTGEEKKETVMNAITKEMLDTKSEVVTPKTLNIFKKILGGVKSIGTVIEWVLPLAKLLKKKK